MHSAGDGLIYSATDLSGFLACAHLPLLERERAFGRATRPIFDDPGLEVLQKRGHEHEQEVLARLRGDQGLTIVEMDDDAPPSADPAERWRTLAGATEAAMREGADVVYQGTLFDGTWLGRPDFLVRVEHPSDLGSWSYEVLDAKLAREAKGGALLQVLLYADLLERVQGRPPRWVFLALGGPDPRVERFRVAEHAAYFRSIRRRFLEHVDSELPEAPDKVPHCDICAWKSRCRAERVAVDHLSRVAGITRVQRRALMGTGVETVVDLAELELPLRPPLEGVSDPALARVHDQARIQVDGRRAAEPIHELLRPVVEGQGLAALPEPSEGDLFFDFEGDPYAYGDGIEYLFGFVDREDSYTGWWALTRAEERQTFDRFMGFLMERLERWPDLHVYHYAPYETTALKRLMGRWASWEEEVDRLLRGGVFVDLHRVVRQGLRASVESYSIKKLEPFYGYRREVDLPRASRALATFEAWLELGHRGDGDDALLDAVLAYNRDDCLSTRHLRDWLEELREELALATGEAVPRPAPKEPAPSEALAEWEQKVADLYRRLTRGVPADTESRTPDQRARWLLAQLLAFHRREKKAFWWEHYRCLALSDAEMIEDRATLGGLEYVGVVDTIKKSSVHRYRFPPQEHGIRKGAVDPATEKSAGTIVALDDDGRTIDLKRAANSPVPHPRALIPHDHVRDRVIRDSLMRLGDAVADHGLDAPAHRAAADLLLARPPRLREGGPLQRPGEDTVAAARRLVGVLDRTVLPIQGPPGAGKTYTGARMIVEALKAGKRVGITATSHKVITNLLDETCRAAAAEGVVFQGVQKAEDEQSCADSRITAADDPKAVRPLLDAGDAQLAAGTAWLWSREDMAGAVDLLFVDEAGQFSLANALAVASAADTLVLLGDPRQLEQPQQGVHPAGAEVSALTHLLGDHATVPEERGLFLARTWRLHPDLCDFTSEIFYRGRLESLAGLERQRLNGPEPFDGSGLRFVPVEHAGNQSVSIEEVDAVADVVRKLLDGCTWTDTEGEERALGLEDILIVAPYNDQVAALGAALPAGARVGTVDKFQGQEAPVVLYSITTSSAEDAPRGMRFLYSPNRLNVATSRARCMAVVVGSPEVFVPECGSPEQMRWANAFCRFRELAESCP